MPIGKSIVGGRVMQTDRCTDKQIDNLQTLNNVKDIFCCLFATPHSVVQCLGHLSLDQLVRGLNLVCKSFSVARKATRCSDD